MSLAGCISTKRAVNGFETAPVATGRAVNGFGTAMHGHSGGVDVIIMSFISENTGVYGTFVRDPPVENKKSVEFRAKSCENRKKNEISLDFRR